MESLITTLLEMVGYDWTPNDVVKIMSKVSALSASDDDVTEIVLKYVEDNPKIQDRTNDDPPDDLDEE